MRRVGGFLDADGRRVARRGLHKPREQCCLRYRHRRRRLAEISKRGRFDAVEAIAEVHLVEIELENLVLAELPFQAGRDDDLGQLAPVGLLRRQKALPGQLLRDRAATLGQPALAKIAQRRAGDANDIDPIVIVEALILDGENGIHQVRRHARQRNINPLFLEDGERWLVGTIEERRRLVHRADARSSSAAGTATTMSCAYQSDPMTAAQSPSVSVPTPARKRDGYRRRTAGNSGESLIRSFICLHTTGNDRATIFQSPTAQNTDQIKDTRLRASYDCVSFSQSG